MIVRLLVSDSQTILVSNYLQQIFLVFCHFDLLQQAQMMSLLRKGRSDEHWWWLMIAIMKIFQKKLRYRKFNCQLVIRNEFPTNLWNFEPKRVTTRKVTKIWFFTHISNKSWQQVSLWTGENMILTIFLQINLICWQKSSKIHFAMFVMIWLRVPQCASLHELWNLLQFVLIRLSQLQFNFKLALRVSYIYSTSK